MRSDSNTRRRVVLPNIGKEEEHQQGSSLRGYVDTPVQEVSWIADLRREAGVNVPARVARIVRRRKPNRKRPEIHAWQPSPWTNKFIKRFVQDWRVRRPGKRLLSKHAEPNLRLRSGRSIALIAARVPPEDGTVLVSKIARKSRLDFQESFADELLDLNIAQDPGARNRRLETPRGLFMVHGENPTPFNVADEAE